MNNRIFSRPLALQDLRITDAFWLREMELVRQQVIPYQWDALNDRIPDAAPSWCMHNFRAAGRLQQKKTARAAGFHAPEYTFRGFEVLPEDPAQPDPDAFYGFVFQDSDFAKWIEAVGYSLTQHPDAQLEALADGAIDVVCAAQDDNGYLDTYYLLHGMDRAFTNLKDHHELYCLGHLVEGAISYYQATGKDKLLNAACRYVDYVSTLFGPGEDQRKGYPGHEIAEMALLRLYEVTGVDRYRDLANFFLDQRGTQPHYFDQEGRERARMEGKPFKPGEYSYYQAHKPVREQDEAVGHAVRAMYLYAGMADAARLNQDESMLDACRKLWRSTVREKLYITGGVGGTCHGEAFSFPFDLPNDSAYSETCAAIGLAFFARRMLQLEPRSEYADVMELALYNTVLAGMALDGQSFFYVNPLSVVPEACRRDVRLHHVKPVRQKWFGCACCPPNIARMVSSVGAYAWTQTEDTLFTHLYIGGTVSFQGMSLHFASGMPYQGNGTVTISAPQPTRCTLAFRLPGWSQGAAVHCEGKDAQIRDGYCYLSGVWQDGDTVTLNFPMPVRMLSADTRVREDAGKVAFVRGPITYCLEEKDNGADLHLLFADTDAAARAQVIDSEIGGHPVKVLKIPGRRQQPSASCGLYQDYAAPAFETRELALVPYFTWANRGEGEMSVWVRV